MENANNGVGIVLFDVDGTLIDGEVIELIAAHAGPEVLRQVREITEAAMRGELDFAESLKRRVALLAGLHSSVLDDVSASLPTRFAPGARVAVVALQRAGYRVGAVSGGFIQVIQEPLVEELGLDFGKANKLEIDDDGYLTGRLVGEIVDGEAKATELRYRAELYGVPLDQTVAFGDGANDIPVFKVAGKSVAVPGAKPALREVAHLRLPDGASLTSALPFLGIGVADIKAAEAIVAEQDRSRARLVRAHRGSPHGLPGHAPAPRAATTSRRPSTGG